MGGNALKTFHDIDVQRIPAEDIYALSSYVKQALESFCDIGLFHVVLAYHTKPDHGDLDVVISDINIHGEHSFGDVIRKAFGQTVPLHVNSNCYSVYVKGHQVDLITVEPESFHAECDFRDYSPFGNTVSRMLKQIGVSWKVTGLYYVFRIGDSYKKNIFLSDSFVDVLTLAGLGYEGYGKFETEEDIFDYVCSAALFRKEIYKLENLNHVNRQRDSKRPDYNRWNSYILTKPDNIEAFQIGDADFNLQQLAVLFPHLVVEIQKCYKEYIHKQSVSVKFNGVLATAWSGLEGKKLGESIAKFKQSFVNLYDFEYYVLNRPSEDIKKRYCEYICS